ncbi:MAG: type I-G CRISPR-associated protein, Cas3-extension family [Candidatus Methylomirabilia bacterium]
MNTRAHEWLLGGLDGGHLLAYLAALGALRTASLVWPKPSPTLRWEPSCGVLRPILGINGVSNQDELVTGLYDKLTAMAGHPALEIGDNLNFLPDQFRYFATVAQLQVGIDSRAADFLCAFACEVILDNEGKMLADTAFRTMRGAGHQHFVKTMRDLISATSRTNIEASLFTPWQYGNTGLSLRFDPQDDRRYALRWDEPSGDPASTERGANRLAIEALPLFPVQPAAHRLETTAFTRRQRKGSSRRDTFLSWPVWEAPVTLEVVRSILALQELQVESPPRDELRARGISEVFRCQRITLGKYRNFTTAVPV